jgi:hypothetical protein
MPKKPNLSERDIQGQIIEYLRLKHYYVQRLNAGEYSLGEGKGYVKGVEAGTPDIMCFAPKIVYKGRKIAGGVVLYFIEVKKPGEEPNEKQQAKMKELEEYGAICLVVHDIEDVIKAGL